MTEADLQTVLDAVTSVPDKPTNWYAKRLGWPGERVTQAVRVLRESGHLTERRVRVYRPKGET